MITDEQIEKAKTETQYTGKIYHRKNSNVGIRIAYEWLDAQNTTKNPRHCEWQLKHIIEQWSGHYVSQSDVEVAAHLHPDITGYYPNYNFSSRLTFPSEKRLNGFPQEYERKKDLQGRNVYKHFE